MRRHCEKFLKSLQNSLDAAYEVQKFIELTDEEKEKLSDVSLVLNEVFKRSKNILNTIEDNRPEYIEAIKTASIPADDLFAWDKHQIKAVANKKKNKLETELEKLQKELESLI